MNNEEFAHEVARTAHALNATALAVADSASSMMFLPDTYFVYLTYLRQHAQDVVHHVAHLEELSAQRQARRLEELEAQAHG